MNPKELAAMSGPDFANLLERVQAEVQHSLRYLYPDVLDDSEQSQEATRQVARISSVFEEALRRIRAVQ